jgi:hypothetical protein
MGEWMYRSIIHDLSTRLKTIFQWKMFIFFNLFLSTFSTRHTCLLGSKILWFRFLFCIMEISYLAYCHDLGFCMTYRLDDWIYSHFVRSTCNYRQLQCYRHFHTLQFTVTPSRVLGLIHSPLVASWQWIHNSLTVTTYHTWSLLHTV